MPGRMFTFWPFPSCKNHNQQPFPSIHLSWPVSVPFFGFPFHLYVKICSPSSIGGGTLGQLASQMLWGLRDIWQLTFPKCCFSQELCVRTVITISRHLSSKLLGCRSALGLLLGWLTDERAMTQTEMYCSAKVLTTQHYKVIRYIPISYVLHLSFTILHLNFTVFLCEWVAGIQYSTFLQNKWIQKQTYHILYRLTRHQHPQF
jgi:hypothetical protein